MIIIENFIRRAQTNRGSLYFSPLPTEQELANCGIDFSIIWNLTSEFADFSHIESKYASKVLVAHIDDYSIPDNIELFLNQLDIVVGELNKGNNVLVHCFGGRGRTGIALALIKNKLEQTNDFESLWFAEENCGGPELDCQIQFVKQHLI